MGGGILQKRRLGQTDIEVSVIGLGTVKFGRNQGVKYPSAFSIPDDQALIQLIQLAKTLGINLIDTAPAYGLSEERLGKLLRGERHEWVISTKAGELFQDGQSYFDFSKSAIQKSVERSLKRLQTDYLDIVLIHSEGNDCALIEEENVFETLLQLKNAGKIRAIGMSTKTIEGGLKTIDEADVAMITLNPVDNKEAEVARYAAQKQKGILVKKAFASGYYCKDKATQTPAEALQFIFNTPGVTSVIIGTINPVHLKQNVESL